MLDFIYKIFTFGLSVLVPQAVMGDLGTPCLGSHITAFRTNTLKPQVKILYTITHEDKQNILIFTCGVSVLVPKATMGDRGMECRGLPSLPEGLTHYIKGKYYIYEIK